MIARLIMERKAGPSARDMKPVDLLEQIVSANGFTCESDYDSDDLPKGPYANGGGEADCPQNCDGCGTFLENPLTNDGVEYVRELCASYEAPDDDGVVPWSMVADRAADDGRPALAEWINFYFSPGM